MIFVKDDVTPPNLKILCAVANVAELAKLRVTVTAGTNGAHMAGSKHYTFAALDVRSKNLSSGVAELFITEVRQRLGLDYDCIFEGQGTPNEHFHIEYDPK